VRAVTQDHYGAADQLKVSDVPIPVPDSTSVLVKVRAASVNALDYHLMRGKPWIGRLLFRFGLTKPKRRIRGVDVAGTVESVSPGNQQFKPGDEVFGLGSGSFAEYVSADVGELQLKPTTLSFEQAAALPVAGVTALQGLRDKGQVKPGQSVLITGAGGGVGSFAVQIAVAMGARVTAVTSSRNVELVQSLGAERVVDYSREDYLKLDGSYDLILDISGDKPFRGLRRLLRPSGRIVVVGGAGLGRVITALIARSFLRHPVLTFIADVRPPELSTLAGWVTEGKLRPTVLKTYRLEETPDAIRLAESRQAQGKLVILPTGS
jgi:NADPH:quinone reductase-like Zn-dependent oxidoreductase